MGCEDVMNLRNLSQEELIKMINEKDKKIEALTEQLNWYSQQIKLQQKKLFGSSSEKTVLPDQISLFDEIELESTPIKQEPELEEITYRRKRKSRQRGIDISSLPVKKVIHDIDNKSCPECGALLRKIGENKRKELVYHPARYEVIEHIQYVYTCDRCNIVNIIFTKNVNLKITRNVNLLLPVLLTYVYLLRPFLVFQHIHKILGSI